jgi:hypothetical protein
MSTLVPVNVVENDKKMVIIMKLRHVGGGSGVWCGGVWWWVRLLPSVS